MNCATRFFIKVGMRTLTDSGDDALLRAVIGELESDGFRIVGLHFAGANRAQNWAHVASRLRDILGEFSATFVA